ncbi:MAG: hypothetical protein PVF05_05520 [Gemmatimonadales bacterium]|jgi:hypothetical protein
MTGRRWGAAAAAAALMLAPSVLHAQQVRGEAGVRFQSLEFERFTDDATVDLVRAVPVVATLDVTAWGFGVENLSFHLRTRASDDLADEKAWPVTEPPLRLVEGYAEYTLPRLTVRAGRTPLHTRLGYESFDGGRVDVRPGGTPVTISAFGGRSLARGATLPVTSPDLTPLGEYRPNERGWLFGGILGVVQGPVRGSVMYRREVDPEASKLASEFVGLSASARLPHGFSLSGGADYDLGFEEWGTADAQLLWSGQVTDRPVSAAARVRRYRPRFDLWSIWGAFSPVPYTETTARASVSPFDGLYLRGSAARFTYGDARTSSPLVSFEQDGWRWTAGAGWSGFADWAFDIDFGAEFGPGASSTHARASAAWRPLDDLRAGAWVARGTRPLEYRIDDAIVRSAGLDLEVDLGRGLRVDGAVGYYDEERTGGFDRSFDHWHVSAGLRYGFGTGADRASLHPAILRIPERPEP